MSVNYSPRSVSDDLILYLDAANVKSYPGSGATWFSLTGKNNATNTASPTYTTTNLGEFTYNGTSQYTSVASLSGLIGTTGAHTVEMFLKFGSIPVTRQWLMLLGQPTTGAHHWLYNTTNGALALGVFGGTQVGTLIPTPGQWMQLCVAISPTGIYVYKNGVIYDSNTTTNTLSLTGTPLAIAQLQPTEAYFAGTIATVKIYNRVLSAAEVAQNFAANRGRFGI